MKLKLGVALVTVYLVWGSTYLAISVADRSLPPLLMLAVRFLIAGGLMYGWSLWRGDVAAERPGKRQWCAAAVVGALLLLVDTGGVAWAEQRVASGTTALLVASVPLFIAVLDRAFFGIKLGIGAMAGIAAGLLGVGLLVGPSAHIDPVGAAVILVASFAWAAGSVYARVAPLPSRPDSFAKESQNSVQPFPHLVGRTWHQDFWRGIWGDRGGSDVEGNPRGARSTDRTPLEILSGAEGRVLKTVPGDLAEAGLTQRPD